MQRAAICADWQEGGGQGSVSHKGRASHKGSASQKGSASYPGAVHHGSPGRRHAMPTGQSAPRR
eukprot:361415-Chlamydomonas_euryale.AAC.11